MNTQAPPDATVAIARRRFLAGLGALPLAGAIASASTEAKAQAVKSNARIVIAGGGTAG